ncbi:MAG: hypothetical protein Q9176_007996 [Flavoplaca citrina]
MGKKLPTDTLTAYELVERSPFPRRRTPSAHRESDDGLIKPTSRLPPKLLPGRHKFRPFVSATVIFVFNVIVLGVLIGHIKYLLPDTDWDYSSIYPTGTSCDLLNKHYSSRWQSTFQINLRGSTRLSFAQAKFIDLVFDLIIGQGGRLLLAAVAYFVFMDALLRSMETTAVSYKLYASLVFSSSSLIATWRAFKAIFSTKGWRAKIYLTWCALAMGYILVFPTLIESMTGYVSPSSAGFNLADGQFVTPDSDELKSCFNVTGGLLMGLDKNDTRVVGPPVHIFDAASSSAGWTGSSRWDKEKAPAGVDASGHFWAMATWERYSYDQPFYGDNLTHANMTKNYYSYYSITIRGQVYKFTDHPLYNYWYPAYCYDDITLRSYQLQELSYCFDQDDFKEYFVWGFSSIILYITLSLQLVWTFGMYCLWLDANLASKLVKAGRTIRGPFRAATDLAEAMNETLGDEYCAYTDQEIEKELEKSGNMLRYYSTLSDDDDRLLHVGMTSRPGARVVLRKQKLYGGEEKGRRDGC